MSFSGLSVQQMTTSKFTFRVMECSMNRIAKLPNLSCPIEFLKYVFINFNFDNDRSALTVATEMITNNRNAVRTSRSLKT